AVAQVLMLFAAPALHWYVDVDVLVRAWLIFSALRVLSGSMLSGLLRWLTLAVLIWLLATRLLAIESSQQQFLPGIILLMAAYALLARLFWQRRDPSRPLGFALAAVSFVMLALWWLVQPLVCNTHWSPWHFASIQMLYLLASAGLILALYQSERLRADFANEVQ